MAKAKGVKTAWVCRECGAMHVKWQGQCRECERWNTLVEEPLDTRPLLSSSRGTTQQAVARPLSKVEAEQAPRLPTPDSEFNRVLDGGLVPGSLVLLGGEPGIGKSTLLLQLGMQLPGVRILYISGEESPQQVRLRAQRLPGQNDELYLLAATDLEAVLREAMELEPQLLFVDSIQTLHHASLEAAPGSVSQVRECTNRLLRFAKETQTTTLLVGHITKEGQLAGPKVLEHLVDTVLEFEGDRHYNFRLLRSTKNRFGRTPELGIYEMRQDGLAPVDNPSALFLSSSGEPLPGVGVGVCLQGTRPLLVETQALLSQATYGTPQRSGTGFDLRRLNMLLAVLDKKCGLQLGQFDVFVNLVGGLRMEDPALDLALAAAMVSSLFDQPLPDNTAFAAELGLTGEVRAVSRLEQRIAEAERLGFQRIVVGPATPGQSEGYGDKLEVLRVSRLTEALNSLGLGG